MSNFDDGPIETPERDRLGIDPLARAISDCIRGIENPRGSVVAVHGPWGSGKSSAINLVLHHLSRDEPGLNVIEFPAWMYHTEDALTAGFLRELRAGLTSRLPKASGKKVAKALRKLSRIVVGARNLFGMAAGAFWGSLAEKVTTATLGAIGGFMGRERTIKDIQEDLANALGDAGKKFLVVIDDLDRLSPDEALVIFRLVKSAGRLPNLMYLLAYDRERTEKAVADRFPSEGAHYLEKVVQAGFDLPWPDQSILNAMLGEALGDLSSGEPGDVRAALDECLRDVVAPELKTPRDVWRLANALPITIGPVRSEVFLPDFVAIEALRVLRPSVYRTMRQNKSAILGARLDQGSENSTREVYTKMLLSSEPEADHEQLRGALAHLFPRLQGIFWHSSNSGSLRDWERQRRVCSSRHFDTYFRFSVSPETIPRKDLEYFLDASRTTGEIQGRIRDALKTTWAKGRTKASYILDELVAHGPGIPLDYGERLLAAMFEIADEMFVEKDGEEAFGHGGNRNRLRILLRFILRGRTTLDERSGILARAMGNAPLQWHLDFSRSAWNDHHPGEPGREPSPEADTLTTEHVAGQLRERSLEMLRAAATDGSVFSAKWPVSLLNYWDLFQPEGSGEVVAFTTKAMRDETRLCQLAAALTLVPGGPDRFLDMDEFRRRLNEALRGGNLDEEQRSIVERFLAAQERRDAEKDPQ